MILKITGGKKGVLSVSCRAILYHGTSVALMGEGLRSCKWRYSLSDKKAAVALAYAFLKYSRQFLMFKAVTPMALRAHFYLLPPSPNRSIWTGGYHQIFLMER